MEAADQQFDCPRCRTPVVERFWGPCQSCREELVRAQQGEATDAPTESVPFEPAMHVVPNHVATKD